MLNCIRSEWAYELGICLDIHANGCPFGLLAADVLNERDDSLLGVGIVAFVVPPATSPCPLYE